MRKFIPETILAISGGVFVVILLIVVMVATVNSWTYHPVPQTAPTATVTPKPTPTVTAAPIEAHASVQDCVAYYESYKTGLLSGQIAQSCITIKQNKVVGEFDKMFLPTGHVLCKDVITIKSERKKVCA